MIGLGLQYEIVNVFCSNGFWWWTHFFLGGQSKYMRLNGSDLLQRKKGYVCCC